ncbi:hypothetical protein E2562_019820 [Oryza meyeriana var. granulata]|uniref:Uncharacterized protein n=1 Tax=Oryza meyeriana var. granulata TaxID=110450 RepID=A0A6G1DKP3_9ORYZ|nr:hypothetical protein E2562_019820 [Oryza meyeriana var. granulata]
MKSMAAAGLGIRLQAVLVMSLLLSPPFLLHCVLAAGSGGGDLVEAGREMKHEGHLVISTSKSTRARRTLRQRYGGNYDPRHDPPFSPGRSNNEDRPGN